MKENAESTRQRLIIAKIILLFFVLVCVVVDLPVKISILLLSLASLADAYLYGFDRIETLKERTSKEE